MEAKKEQWQRLCEQIAVEQDPTRFTALVDELNKLLDEKERRLSIQREPAKAFRENPKDGSAKT
jgi:hypothetical protein